jgi:hypothetical protein
MMTVLTSKGKHFLFLVCCISSAFFLIKFSFHQKKKKKTSKGKLRPAGAGSIIRDEDGL